MNDLLPIWLTDEMRACLSDETLRWLTDELPFYVDRGRQKVEAEMREASLRGRDEKAWHAEQKAVDAWERSVRGEPARADTQRHLDCKDRKDFFMATKAIITPPGIASFVNLKDARPVVAGGEPRFSINLLFDEAAQRTAEFKALMDAIAEAATEKWGKKIPPSMRSPLRDGAEKEGSYSGYRAGIIFINPWSKERPGVVDAQRNEILDLSTVYAGQLARAFVRPFAYDSGSNKGVGLLLDAVQILKDGERLDGRKSASDMFSAFEEV